MADRLAISALKDKSIQFVLTAFDDQRRVRRFLSKRNCALCLGVITFLITSTPVVLGVLIAVSTTEKSILEACSSYDGQHYREIAVASYSYDPAKPSNIAFFPAYPLLVRLFRVAISWSAISFLLVVPNLCLLASFVLLFKYLRARNGALKYCDDDPSKETECVGFNSAQLIAVLAFGLFPTSFFYRMAYSESIFLLGSIVTLLAIAQKRCVVLVALCAGFTTATRPVGIALLLPVLLYLWQLAPSWQRFFLRACWVAPLALWGLLAYMAFQWLEFGDPLAFAKTQSHWLIGSNKYHDEKWLSLLAFEPIWRVYDSSYPGYWEKIGPPNVFWNLQFANPLLYVSIFALVIVGIVRGWLNRFEVSFSIGVLLIPYVTRAAEMCFASHGRFAAVAFPAYIVAGKLIASWPNYLKIIIGLLFAALLCLYTVCFAGGNGFF